MPVNQYNTQFEERYLPGYGPITQDFKEIPQGNADPYASALVGGQEDDPYASARVDKIEPTENLLQRAIRNSGVNTMNFGPMGSFSGVQNSENDIPDINQFLGNVIGGEIGLMTAGHPNAGAAIGGTIGRAVGETGKQTEGAIFRGKPFNIKEIGKQAAIGGATESIMLPFASAGTRFLSGPAGKEFKAKIGSVLGNIIESIGKKGIRVPASDIVDPIFQAIDSIRKNIEVDPGISDFLEKAGFDAYDTAQKKGGYLEVADLKNLKSRLDKFLEGVGVYGDKVKGKAKGAYSAIENVIGSRNAVGEGIQGMAEKAGEGSAYKTAKNAYSTVANTYNPSGKHGILKSFLEAGSIRDIMSGNLPAAAGQIVTSELIGSNPLLTGIFNAGKVGKAIPASIASLINRYSQ